MRWKLLGSIAAAIAGIATRRAVVVGWKAATGKLPPSNPESPAVHWGEAVAWHMASEALVGMARMLAIRKAAGYYRASTGHLPRGLDAVV